MTIEQSDTALDLTATPSPVSIAEWVGRASSAHALMVGLVDSFFVPAQYKPSGPNGRDVAIANGVGAILLGQSLGVDPLTALQQIYVVHGRPGMYARFKVALCVARGHEIWEESRSDESVTVCGRSRGSDRVHTITVTMEMARRAGWTSNPQYTKTPADMLFARAAGRVADRVGGADLFGIRSVEDLRDEDTNGVPVRPVAAVSAFADTKVAPRRPDPEDDRPPARTVRVGTHAPETAGDPPLKELWEGESKIGYTTAPVGPVREPVTLPPADVPAGDDQAEPPAGQDFPSIFTGPELVTLAKMHEIRFMLKQLMMEGSGPAAAAVVSTLAGRQVDGPAELTVAEGDLVLSRLAHMTGEREKAEAAEREIARRAAPGEGAERESGRRVNTVTGPGDVSQAQLRKMGALFSELGITGQGSRADRLTVVSHILGHPVGSSKEISKDEASQLIDSLEGMKARGAAGDAELESILRPETVVEDDDDTDDGSDDDDDDPELFTPPDPVRETYWVDQG